MSELPGAARLQLADGVPLLRPEEQVFEAMIEGWRNQQLARNLAFSTIEGRETRVRAFVRHCDAFPWHWSHQMADEWFGDLRAVRHVKHSTMRSYQEAVRSLCTYLVDRTRQAEWRLAAVAARSAPPARAVRGGWARVGGVVVSGAPTGDLQ